MISLAQKGYTHQEVFNALCFQNGTREVGFRYDLLNKYDIKIGELESATGSINLSSMATIKKTAKFTLNESNIKEVDYLNDRIQPFFVLTMPNGEKLEWSLGIFLISSPNRRTSGKIITREIEAYDKTLILEQDKFLTRYFIPKGTNYTNAIKVIIQSAGIVNVNIPTIDTTLKVDKEYEIGSSKITAVNDMLNSINYTSLFIDENGYAIAKPYKSPAEREAEHYYIDDSLSILIPDAEEELDIFNTPNVFMRVASNPETEDVYEFTYTNNTAENPLSTISRGRHIVDFDELTDIPNQQTLNELVYRVAFEKSQAYSKIRFKTALMPHHANLDMLYLRHSSLKTEGKFTETSWSMDLLTGGLMQHEARRIILI